MGEGYEFVLCTEDRNWFLRSVTEEERSQWVRVIKKIQRSLGIIEAEETMSTPEISPEVALNEWDYNHSMEVVELETRIMATASPTVELDQWTMELSAEEFEVLSSPESSILVQH